MNNLDALCWATGARIVFSTDWRHSHTLEDMTKLLIDLGVTFMSPPDQTPVLKSYEGDFAFYQPRSSEIEAYIKAHDVQNFVVLDDIAALAQCALSPNLVLCEYEEGFTAEKLVEALKILSL